tara:strand:- start:330 stop:806 length:477 start_codon:yes stop_codon:yes gene_type:complete
MSFFFSRKKIYILIFLFSLTIISSVLYIEFILGQKPCVLCVYQRIPFVLALFICFVGYNYSKADNILILLIAIFILSIIISGYHFGIENNIFKEFSGCSVNNTEATSKTEILKSLQNMPSSCKEVNFTLFGLSLSGLNFLSSLIVAIYCIRTLVYEKN